MADKKKAKQEQIGWVNYDPTKVKRNQDVRVGNSSTGQQADVRINGDGFLITSRGVMLDWEPSHYLIYPDLPEEVEKVED